jgi:maltooligosyltrehalose trehalohydrolase
VGNRARGERLSALVPRGIRKLMAAILMLAPETPLVFMGQEFDEQAPFQFFTDFGDPALQKAVSEGRRREFKDFDFREVPDPQDPATFERSRLNWADADNDMLEWYRRLLDLRRELVIDCPGERRSPEVLKSERTCRAELQPGEAVLRLQMPREFPRLMLLCTLKPGVALPPQPGWKLRLSMEENGYGCSAFSS